VSSDGTGQPTHRCPVTGGGEPAPVQGRATRTDSIKPTTETDRPNLSTEHQNDGDARRPSDTLDKGQASTEGSDAPKRKSSLL
jgi:hypothetical protein